MTINPVAHVAAVAAAGAAHFCSVDIRVFLQHMVDEGHDLLIIDPAPLHIQVREFVSFAVRAVGIAEHDKISLRSPVLHLVEKDRPVCTFGPAVDIQYGRVFFSGLIAHGSQHPAVDLLVAVPVTVKLRADIGGLCHVSAAKRPAVQPGHPAKAPLFIRMIDLLQLHVVEPHHPQVAGKHVKIIERPLLLYEGLCLPVKTDPPEHVAGAFKGLVIHVVSV